MYIYIYIYIQARNRVGRTGEDSPLSDLNKFSLLKSESMVLF